MQFNDNETRFVAIIYAYIRTCVHLKSDLLEPMKNLRLLKAFLIAALCYSLICLRFQSLYVLYSESRGE